MPLATGISHLDCDNRRVSCEYNDLVVGTASNTVTITFESLVNLSTTVDGKIRFVQGPFKILSQDTLRHQDNVMTLTLDESYHTCMKQHTPQFPNDGAGFGSSLQPRMVALITESFGNIAQQMQRVADEVLGPYKFPLQRDLQVSFKFAGVHTIAGKYLILKMEGSFATPLQTFTSTDACFDSQLPVISTDFEASTNGDNSFISGLIVNSVLFQVAAWYSDQKNLFNQSIRDFLIWGAFFNFDSNFDYPIVDISGHNSISFTMNKVKIKGTCIDEYHAGIEKPIISTDVLGLRGRGTVDRNTNSSTGDITYSLNMTSASFDVFNLYEPPLILPNATLTSLLNKVLNITIEYLDNKLAKNGIGLPPDDLFWDWHGPRFKILPYPTYEIKQEQCGNSTNSGYIVFTSTCDSNLQHYQVFLLLYICILFSPFCMYTYKNVSFLFLKALTQCKDFVPKKPALSSKILITDSFSEKARDSINTAVMKDASRSILISVFSSEHGDCNLQQAGDSVALFPKTISSTCSPMLPIKENYIGFGHRREKNMLNDKSSNGTVDFIQYYWKLGDDATQINSQPKMWCTDPDCNVCGASPVSKTPSQGRFVADYTCFSVADDETTTILLVDEESKVSQTPNLLAKPEDIYCDTVRANDLIDGESYIVKYYNDDMCTDFLGISVLGDGSLEGKCVSSSIILPGFGFKNNDTDVIFAYNCNDGCSSCGGVVSLQVSVDDNSDNSKEAASTVGSCVTVAAPLFNSIRVTSAYDSFKTCPTKLDAWAKWVIGIICGLSILAIGVCLFKIVDRHFPDWQKKRWLAIRKKVSQTHDGCKFVGNSFICICNFFLDFCSMAWSYLLDAVKFIGNLNEFIAQKWELLFNEQLYDAHYEKVVMITTIMVIVSLAFLAIVGTLYTPWKKFTVGGTEKLQLQGNISFY